MTDGKIYEGDVGVRFIVVTEVDLTDATTMQLKVIKGDLSSATWNGIICPTDSTAIQYDSIEGDLGVSGKYKMCAYIEKTSASKHTGTLVEFKVYDIFK
jgi:hypothetical protein